MSSSRKGTKKKAEKYILKLTLKSAFFWLLALAALLVWVFFLGVFVGRGNLSFKMVKNKFVGVRDVVSEKTPSDMDLKEKPGEDPKFDFYDVLSSKKEEAAKKNRPTVKKKTPKKIPPEKSEGKPAHLNKPSNGNQKYVLQIGSFKDRSRAMTLVDRLTDQGYPVFYSKTEIKGKCYYRVKCGPFNREKRADEYKNILVEKEGVQGFVTRDGK